MVKTSRKNASPLSFASVTITLIAVLSLFSAAMPNNPRVSFHSPTATYSGYLSVSFTGAYHFVEAQPLCSEVFPPCLVPSEAVYYLRTENGTAIQLVFYCGDNYCNLVQQIPFGEGEKIYAEGTLLVPSKWPSNQYYPALYFVADLYVFNYTAV
jgi:hypothetical protein